MKDLKNRSDEPSFLERKQEILKPIQRRLSEWYSRRKEWLEIELQNSGSIADFDANVVISMSASARSRASIVFQRD